MLVVLRLTAAVLVVVCSLSPAFGAATLGGPVSVPLPLFPPNNWWNTDISAAPVDPGSAGFIQVIINRHGGVTWQARPDFGGNYLDGTIGIPYLVVEGAQEKKTVTFVNWPEESDGVDHSTETSFPFYPVPDEAITTFGWVEGGAPGNVDQRDDADRHILMLDKTNNTLYELYNVWHNGTNWEAASGAFFDMNTNNRRPEGWTSADAAGLAILPGLVRYDEYEGPHEIRHAFRVTVQRANGHVYPASHTAGSFAGNLPMGARLRLKASKDISGFSPQLQRVFRAMKRYGLIVADNGSDLFVSGTYDTRWDNGILNPAFAQLKASDFEVVKLGWKPSITFILTMASVVGRGEPASATLTAYDVNDNVATGYRGTVRFTSPGATLPADYTFTAADAGSHSFPSGFTLNTPGAAVITFTDLADATITGSHAVVVGPTTPAGLTATASGTTSVSLSWQASTGAAQYEVMRASTPTGFTTLTTTTVPAYVDNSVSAGASYLYKVRAIDANGFPSPFSAPDVATAMTFTNDPLSAGTTTVKSVHFTELRQGVNAMRAAAGLTPASFTDPTLSSTLPVKGVHLLELRTALNEARTTLGLTAMNYTDLALGGVVVKAVHVSEIRNGIK